MWLLQRSPPAKPSGAGRAGAFGFDNASFLRPMELRTSVTRLSATYKHLRVPEMAIYAGQRCRESLPSNMFGTRVLTPARRSARHVGLRACRNTFSQIPDRRRAPAGSVDGPGWFSLAQVGLGCSRATQAKPRGLRDVQTPDRT